MTYNPVANNQHNAARFSFWQPVDLTFNEDPNAVLNNQPEISNKIFWTLGSFADQFLSLGQPYLKVEATPINAKKVYFETQQPENFPKWVTALKVAYFVLSLGTIPLVALLVKFIYKTRLNDHCVWNPNVTNGVDLKARHTLAEKMIGKTKIILDYGSVTEETTDVIVNAANRGLWAGGGVCHYVHQAAGQEPFDECQDILNDQYRKEIDCGEAVLTTSGNLSPKVKAIVHAAGPNYAVDIEKEKGAEYLASAYRNSLEIIALPPKHSNFISAKVKATQPLRSIAFPSISTGLFGAPLNESAVIALKTIKDFIVQNPDALDLVRIDFLHVAKGVKTAPAYMAALKEI